MSQGKSAISKEKKINFYFTLQTSQMNYLKSRVRNNKL